jgi:hypothetical protein
MFEGMSKDTEAATMEAETIKGRPEPAFRKPNQTRAGRQRKEMVADFVARLGGPERISPIQLQDVHRVVDLMLLCQTARAELAAGNGTIGDVVKLEGTLARAMKRLNLKPGAVANRGVPLRERLRGGGG